MQRSTNDTCLEMAFACGFRRIIGFDQVEVFSFFYLGKQSKKTKSRNRHDFDGGGLTTRTIHDTILNHFPQSYRLEIKSTILRREPRLFL